MFAPSFFTGRIQRFGIIKILLGGLLAYILAMVTAFFGDQFSHYFVALFLLGFGEFPLYRWYAGCRVATAEERGRVQGVADLTTTSLVAMASLTAGGLHSQFADVLILAGSVPIFILGCGLGWLGFHQRQSSYAHHNWRGLDKIATIFYPRMLNYFQYRNN